MLALLVCGCVFAAIAGPAISLHLRTEALHQTLNQPGPLGTAIEVNASWNTFTQAFTGQSALAEDDLSAATSALASGLAASVPMAAGGWGGLTTSMHDVLSGTGPLPVGYHPELEVTYRDQLASNVQVVAGRLADAAVPPGFHPPASSSASRPKSGKMIREVLPEYSGSLSNNFQSSRHNLSVRRMPSM